MSWRFWEAYLYVFYMPERLQGVPPLTTLTSRVGPLPKNLRPEASEALRLAEARVLRVLEALGGSFARVLRILEALGGSFVRILRVREAPGGPTSNQPKRPGGSAKEGPHACGGRGGGGSGAVGSELRSYEFKWDHLRSYEFKCCPLTMLEQR